MASAAPLPPPTFLAPSFCVFFAPSTFALRAAPPAVAVLRNAADELVRDADGAASAYTTIAGDLERGSPGGLLRKGEAVRLPPTGGVCVRLGGLLGRLIAGLSQEEKKSSPDSLLGVLAPSAKVGERTSVITTSSGNLAPRRC